MEKYYDENEVSTAQRERIQFLRAWQKAAELDGQKAPRLTPGIALLARSRMQAGKANGSDAVVVGMLRRLPMSAVYVVADLFAKRYAGDLLEGVESWSNIINVFPAKVVHPKRLEDFRGGSLISAMSNWYMQYV